MGHVRNHVPGDRLSAWCCGLEEDGWESCPSSGLLDFTGGDRGSEGVTAGACVKQGTRDECVLGARITPPPLSVPASVSALGALSVDSWCSSSFFVGPSHPRGRARWRIGEQGQDASLEGFRTYQSTCLLLVTLHDLRFSEFSLFRAPALAGTLTVNSSSSRK